MDIKKYIGQEVLYKQTQKAIIKEITSYAIKVELLKGGCRMFETGTGAYDNAVANGHIKFIDKELKEIFIEEYEEYVHSAFGEIETFDYYSRKYS